MQPVQQRECLAGLALGEQQPGQHQMPGLPGVVRLVVRAEAGLLRPPGGSGKVALGQQQPRPLRRDRVEQAGRARRACPASPIASSAPAGSPLACRIHASVTRPAASGGVWTNCRHSAMPSVTCRSARVELVALVGHLGQAHMRGARRRQRRPAGHGGGFQRLPAGPDGRVQAALGALNLAEVSSTPHAVTVGWPATRHPAMLDTKACSASASRPRSHSATARNPWMAEFSIHSPSPRSARAREANAAVASASPRSWAR